MPNSKDFYGSSNSSGGSGGSQRHYGGSSGGDHRKSSNSSSGARGKTEWRKTAFRVCGEWSEQFSSKGKIYYYNSRTEVSQWQRPREWALGDPSPSDLSNARRNALGSGQSSQSSATNSGSISTNTMAVSSSMSISSAVKRPSSVNGGRGSPGGAKRIKCGNNGGHYSHPNSTHLYHRNNSSSVTSSGVVSHPAEMRPYHYSISSSSQRLHAPGSGSLSGTGTSTIASVMSGVKAPTFYHHSQQQHAHHQQQQSSQQPSQQVQQHQTQQQEQEQQPQPSQQQSQPQSQQQPTQQQQSQQPQPAQQHQQQPQPQQPQPLQQGQQSHHHHQPQRYGSNQHPQHQQTTISRDVETGRRTKAIASRIDPTNDDMDISPDSSPCTSNDEDSLQPGSSSNRGARKVLPSASVSSSAAGNAGSSTADGQLDADEVDSIVAALRERLNVILNASETAPGAPVDGAGMAELLKKLIAAATSSNVSNGPVKRVLESLESMLAKGTFGEVMDSGSLSALLQQGLEGVRMPSTNQTGPLPSDNASRRDLVSGSSNPSCADGARDSSREGAPNNGDARTALSVSPSKEDAEEHEPAPLSPICPSLDSQEFKKYVIPEVWERSQQMTALARVNYQATMEAWLVATPTNTPTLIDRTARRMELQANKLADQVDRLTSIIYCDLCAELKCLRSLVRLSSMKVELTQKKREMLTSLIESFEKRPHVVRN